MSGFHHHHGHPSGGGETDSSANLRLAFFLNLGFTVIELAGGLLTNSIAVLSDALHDFGDSLSLGLAWYFDRLSRRGRTPRHTYGYRRYRLLGGLITGVLLLAGLGFILWNSVMRLRDPQPVHAFGMLLLAVLGVAVNGAAVWRVRRGSSLTEKVVSWHLLEDALGWVAVLLGAGAMMIWDYPIIDPLLSIGIALVVIWNVVGHLRKVFAVLLQTTPETFDVEAFEREARQLPQVCSLHHTHGWSIDGESHVLSTHLVMEAHTSRDDVVAAKRAVWDFLRPHGFAHVTIEVELEGEPCGMGTAEGDAGGKDCPGS